MTNKMEVKFSRHAKRRAKLYDIPESVVEQLLKSLDIEKGEHALIKNIEGFKYPIKIVVSVDVGLATVITNYPIKKERRL